MRACPSSLPRASQIAGLLLAVGEFAPERDVNIQFHIAHTRIGRGEVYHDACDGLDLIEEIGGCARRAGRTKGRRKVELELCERVGVGSLIVRQRKRNVVLGQCKVFLRKFAHGPELRRTRRCWS
jgi:hypothetical protein